mmetsp:Transcript_31220/g.52439  ORF Transcript_31220/g.52439 Transcript_31220/m.52439 type:complete len:239 (+) Transcript_31220:550-1266(+)|eukprot:CAMPEP_0198213074 /NCGR_PEP_ID=MMETSP1445-20131203/28661_1 /TAXON_ID=36898 /ORGANISM="Pyramimonas sp., Strain CCMP2087" /LENGTH=238 /DNA_ID=CAMNT_0043887667 /DNA_START=432 /DNA_END=1148 /DNA_ORIENTATION=+
MRQPNFSASDGITTPGVARLQTDARLQTLQQATLSPNQLHQLQDIREPVFETTLVDGLKFSWGPKQVPNKVKLRKKIDVWPLRFTVGADYDMERKEWEGVCSCKDKVLGGRLTLNVQRKHLDYRKSISLGGSSVLSLRAGLDYTDVCPPFEAGQWRTSLSVVMEPIHDRHTQAVAALNSFDIRTKIPIAPALRAEICGSISIPQPAAEYTHSTEGLQIAFGQGGFHCHVAQVNAVIHL